LIALTGDDSSISRGLHSVTLCSAYRQVNATISSHFRLVKGSKSFGRDLNEKEFFIGVNFFVLFVLGILVNAATTGKLEKP
jgi:hypothetical protein